jgi:hypothetical protein
MASQQMINLLHRYSVTTEAALLQAIAEEYTEMCCDPGDEPFRAEDMGATLDQMLEAEYQRIAGGAYDALLQEQIDAEYELAQYRAEREYDPDAAYERWLEDRGAYYD